MNKKILIPLIILGIFITNGVQFLIVHNQHQKYTEKVDEKIASLEASLQSYGTDICCYTVATTVKAGDEITEESIVPFMKPGAYVSSMDVTDMEFLLGKYFRIPLSNGTSITYDMVMDEDVYDDTKDIDIYVDSWPVGLEVGDYIDVVITYPYGDKYTILSKKRVHNLNGNTLKVYMDAGEQHTYSGAMVDYALNKDYGTTITATKYVEPGLQQAAVAYYAVPDNIAALIQADPNVIDKTDYASLASWRDAIDELLVIFRDDEDTVDSDGAKLAAMRDAYNSSIMSDVETYVPETEETSETDDYWSSTPPSDEQGSDVTSDLE